MRYLEEEVPESYGTYFEPFVGSAALFFQLRPSSSVLSDLNPDLINFYHFLKEEPELLFSEACKIERSKDVYLEVRRNFISEGDGMTRAVQFFYLNRNCFNGLYRTNKKGEFNVPYASSGQSGYPSLSDFFTASELLKGSSVVRGDFVEVVGDRVKSNDFVYLDPPYIKSEGRIFSEYVKGHFSKVDLDRLGELLQHINDVGAYFIVSFIDDEAIYPISNKWNSRAYSVQRNISGFASHRRRSPELLIKNW